MAQVQATPKTYDVVIVGSGAGGGVAAHVLANAGAKICMLEAGDWFDCTKDTKMFQWPYQAPHRGSGTHEKAWGAFDATTVGGWQVPGEPYTNAEGSDWVWWRARMLGGRTTITAVSRCAWARTTSSPTAAMAKASIGQSPTMSWLPITTKPKN